MRKGTILQKKFEECKLPSLEELKQQRAIIDALIRQEERRLFANEFRKHYSVRYIKKLFPKAGITCVRFSDLPWTLIGIDVNDLRLQIDHDKNIKINDFGNFDMALDEKSFVLSLHVHSEEKLSVDVILNLIDFYHFMLRFRDALPDISRYVGNSLLQSDDFWVHRQMFYETVGLSKLPKDLRKKIWQLIMNTK